MPLGTVSDSNLRELGQILWNWELCDACAVDQACTSHECPWRRSRHLQAFFGHFRSIVLSYDAIETATGFAALDTLEEVFAALRLLRENSSLDRDALQLKLFGQSNGPAYEGAERQELALNTLMEVCYLINCAAQPQSLASLELGRHTVPWSGKMTLPSFIDTSFKSNHATASKQKQGNTHMFEGPITAYLLKKEAYITIQPTDNLRNHLRLDERNNVLQVFHHAGFLKEQLRLSKDVAADTSVEEGLKHGALPRALVLETLNTLQRVLFPQGDLASSAVLASLCSSCNFDKDCYRQEWSIVRNAHEVGQSYGYWQERLEILREKIETPGPQGVLEQWLERRSAPRYAMLATLIGVLIAIILGAAALAVSAYQTWIAYNAWKHPVAAPTSMG